MLVEFCKKKRWLKCDPLLTWRPTYKKALVVPTASPTNFSEVPAVSVLYHKTGLFCVRRLAPPTSIAQLSFNDRQLTCDKSRRRTAYSVKVCHSPILHLRSRESTQLPERGFFFLYGNARRCTGLLLIISTLFINDPL